MAKLPLEGLRIIDISNVFSLPYATGLLADLGAEIIKIEGPGRLDVTRQGAFSGVHPDNQPGPDPWNRTSTYNLLNRGKKSLAVDLSRPEGREVLKDLIRRSDVLMENFSPRVMRSWGLDYPNQIKLKPDLIMVSCSGYGQSGPYSLYPAQATTQEATHGLAHVTGYRGDIPSKAGQSFVDFLATWACFMGTALALRYRHRFKKGLWIDVAMYPLGCYMVSDFILDWEANHRRSERIGNRHPWRAPQGCYRCAGDDQWCAVSVFDDEEWAALCRAIGEPELALTPRFASNGDRMAHHDEIDGIIARWTGRRPKFEVMERLQSAGVRAGAVLDARDLNVDPHLRARGFLENLEFPPERNIGKRGIIGRPWRLTKTPLAVRGPGPTLGQHNREVLQDILGYSDAQYADLERAGIVGTAPTNAKKVAHMDMDERVRQGRLAYWDPDFKQRLGI
ncbi:MAG: CoA transferase [Candidatus Lambdaproteobacteria bacterium]|nr:CoA transferase [Candidatus Lambdaproteobacteria bacterium]